MTNLPPATERDSAKSRRFNVRFNAGLNRLLELLKVEDVPHIKRIIITVVGGTVVLIGAALVFLPGPGLLVILGGFAILGTEYAWARRWMRKGKLMAKKALSQTQKILSPKEKPEAEDASPAAELPAQPKRESVLPPDGGNTTLVH